MYYLLLFHCNSSYANASQYYVVRLVIRDGLLRVGVREIVSVFFFFRGGPDGYLLQPALRLRIFTSSFIESAVKQGGVFAIRANVISFGNQFFYLKRNM